MEEHYKSEFFRAICEEETVDFPPITLPSNEIYPLPAQNELLKIYFSTSYFKIKFFHSQYLERSKVSLENAFF